jgi:zinc/manganese transport system substrate-binding protein
MLAAPTSQPTPRSLRRFIAGALAASLLLAGVLAGCGDSGAGAASTKLRVVAAESSWGSLVAQLGGERAQVTEIVASPAADPHDYEPTSADARAMAEAQLVVVNGLGYDQWASQLLEANPSTERAVVDVGDLLGLKDGDNPHQWYSPAAVRRVIARVGAEYERLDPAHAAYFRERRRQLEGVGLAAYDRVIAQIRKRFAGTPVGASESIFAPLAPALGLRLLTPGGFLDAVSEGLEPAPADKVAADRQIADGEIDTWVYNSQNANPDVRRLNAAAEAAGIPVATVTETPTPEGVSFQAWQARQLRSLEAALAKGARG